MGLGDVKMLAMIGATLGWMPLLPMLFLASVLGAVTGIAFGALRRGGMQLALPFGVFLGIATLVVVFFGNTLLGWYGTRLLG
jgi:leader peptidase (prepilin peptidase)/N-methyltransferase